MKAVAASPYTAGPLRDYLIPALALIASVYVPYMAIVMLFIVTGQAHFVTGYWYQYKAGKMDARYLLVAALLLAGSIFYFVSGGGLVPILLAVGVLFSAHFAYDEILLHGESRTPAKLVTVLGFAVFFGALVVSFIVPGLRVYAPYALCIPLLAFAIRYALDRTRPGKAEQYLWLIEALIFLIAVGFGNPGGVLGVIVLLHVFNWYVGFGGRVAHDAVRRRAYWTQVVVILAILSGLFFAYVQFHLPGLEFIFKSTYYYAWAIAHIVLSFVTTLPRNAAVPTV